MARLRALVCDDERVVRSVVSSVLETCGYEVVGEAGLALESLVMADIVRPDVIVLDISLPGMSGIEVLPTLKAAAPEAVIIVYTAFDSRRDEAMAAGAFDVVDKADPTGMAALESTLQVVAETLVAVPVVPAAPTHDVYAATDPYEIAVAMPTPEPATTPTLAEAAEEYGFVPLEVAIPTAW